VIVHTVLLKVRSDVTDEMVDSVFSELEALKGEIPGLLDFAGGLYSSPEGLNRGFDWGFCMTFDSAQSRDAYLPHPAHQAVGSRLVELAEGGLDGILAFDFAT
jgi:hypothetical protein